MNYISVFQRPNSLKTSDQITNVAMSVFIDNFSTFISALAVNSCFERVLETGWLIFMSKGDTMRKEMFVALGLFGGLLFGCVSSCESIDVDSADSQVFTTEQSFVEYFDTREQFVNSEMPKDSPEVLGLIELAVIEVTCSDSAGTPCEGNLLILSEDPIHSGEQEFYMAFTMGTGYVYYGPFLDDLQRILNESESIDSLKK